MPDADFIAVRMLENRSFEHLVVFHRGLALDLFGGFVGFRAKTATSGKEFFSCENRIQALTERARGERPHQRAGGATSRGGTIDHLARAVQAARALTHITGAGGAPDVSQLT